MVKAEQIEQVQFTVRTRSPEDKVLELLVAVLAFALVLYLIHLSNRRSVKEMNGKEPPERLRGSWPPGVQERYLALDADGRRRWHRRYNLTVLVLVIPLSVAAAVTAIFVSDLMLVGAICVALALALGFAVSGFNT